MAEALPQFPPFDISDEPGVKGPRWKKYITRFKKLMVAMNITDAAKQRALLLHYVYLTPCQTQRPQKMKTH